MDFDGYGEPENEFNFDEGGFVDEEDDLDEYKTPTDELEYGGFGGGDDDGFIVDEESNIDTTAGRSEYGEGARTGMARAVDIDEDLGTMMMDDKFKKMDMMSRTPEDMFRMIARKIKERYEMSDGVYDDSLRIMQYLNKQNRKLKFKNPAAILFALLCIKDGEILDDNIDDVYNNMAKHESMYKTDLLRYIFFVQDVLKNR